jgi:glycosyltransferase involved in cell wall biosynthesis
MSKPILSVITVVYNGERFIERTIKSVISQSYNNIEYIVIDGKSKDKTIEILNNYKEHIDILVSQRDEGIYDAMNKGLKLATGDYVIFMNAGDQFYANDTIEQIFRNEDYADIYYGDTLIVDEDNQSLGKRRLRPPEKLTWKSFRMGMRVCHQSFIIKRKLAPLYDTNYKIAADIDWCISGMKASSHICNTHIFISRYISGGASWQNQRKALKERLHIMRLHYGLMQTLFFHLIITIRFIFNKITTQTRNT